MVNLVIGIGGRISTERWIIIRGFQCPSRREKKNNSIAVYLPTAKTGQYHSKIGNPHQSTREIVLYLEPATRKA